MIGSPSSLPPERLPPERLPPERLPPELQLPVAALCTSHIVVGSNDSCSLALKPEDLQCHDIPRRYCQPPFHRIELWCLRPRSNLAGNLGERGPCCG